MNSVRQRVASWPGSLLVVLMLLPIYLATATYGVVQSNDPRSAAQAGYMFATTGSLAYDAAWERGVASWEVEGRDGRFYSNRFPGVIATSAATYWLAHVTGLIDAGAPTPADVPLWPAALAAALIATAAVGLSYCVFRTAGLERRFALGATMIVGLASPVWSVSANALWTHGITHALLCATLLSLRRARPPWAAICSAAAVAVRPHLAPAIVVLGLAGLRRRDQAAPAVGVAVGLLVVAAYSQWLFASPLPSAGYNVDEVIERLPAASPGTFGMNLLSWIADPWRSVVLFAPLWWMAVASLPRVWSSAPRWTKVAAAAGLVYAMTQLGLIRASGGTFFFGHRTTIETLVLTAPLLALAGAAAWRDSRVMRIAYTVLFAVSLATHLYGAIVTMPAAARAAMLAR